MAVRDIYDLVEEHFGEPASPDLVMRLRGISKDDAFAFANRYREWVMSQNPQVPSKLGADLRPLVEGSHNGPRGVSLYAPVFTADEDVLWALYDGLVHHLLYCHSVAVENPLMHLISTSRQTSLLARQRGMLGFHVNTAIILSRYVELLVALGGLVRCGAVVLVETGPHAMTGFTPGVPTYDEADARSAGRYALSRRQFDRILSQVGGELAPLVDREAFGRSGGSPDKIAAPERDSIARSYLQIALGQLVLGERVAQRTGDLDLYLRNRLQRRALTVALAEKPEWLGVEPASTSSARRIRELDVLGKLLTLDLPDLSGVGPRDVLAIRRSSETFERWRLALRSGLSAAEEIADQPLSAHGSGVRREIADEIRAAGIAVDTDIGRSDVLTAGRKGFVAFGVGLLTTAVTGGAAVPGQLAGKAAVTAVSALAGTGTKKVGQRDLASAVRRHTVLFDDTPRSM